MILNSPQCFQHDGAPPGQHEILIPLCMDDLKPDDKLQHDSDDERKPAAIDLAASDTEEHMEESV